MEAQYAEQYDAPFVGIQTDQHQLEHKERSWGLEISAYLCTTISACDELKKLLLIVVSV